MKCLKIWRDKIKSKTYQSPIYSSKIHTFESSRWKMYSPLLISHYISLPSFFPLSNWTLFLSPSLCGSFSKIIDGAHWLQAKRNRDERVWKWRERKNGKGRERIRAKERKKKGEKDWVIQESGMYLNFKANRYIQLKNRKKWLLVSK